MPKYRVSVSYDITIYETYEVGVNREDYDTDGDYQAALEGFEENPYDFCDITNRTKREEGDIRDASWDEDVEEINLLDQIVEAVNETPEPQ